MGIEDDFLLEDEDDAKTIEFIKNYLPIRTSSRMMICITSST